MDLCSQICEPDSAVLNSVCDLSMNAPQPSTGDLSVNDLVKGLNEFLNVQDDHKPVSCSNLPSGKKEVGQENLREELHQSKLKTEITGKCLSKCATFPCSSKKISTAASIDGENGEVQVEDGKDAVTTKLVAQDGDAESVNLPYSRSVSLPTPLKLVSAMKGSREKQGMLSQKLTVTWAPDVYDPTPTAVSHVVTSKNQSQRHRSDNRKNNKNKQKGGGKSSRGSKGKDKKQVRKYGGSSNRCFQSLDDDDREADCNIPQANAGGFNTGSPDPYCGSSFLKKSVTTLHFSVAEAT